MTALTVACLFKCMIYTYVQTCFIYQCSSMFVTVTTTAGTGSETTGTAVFDLKHMKAKTGNVTDFNYSYNIGISKIEVSFLWQIKLLALAN